MVATWRAIWLLITVGAILALAPGMFGVLNGVTFLGLFMLLTAWFFIAQRGWE